MQCFSSIFVYKVRFTNQLKIEGMGGAYSIDEQTFCFICEYKKFKM